MICKTTLALRWACPVAMGLCLTACALPRPSEAPSPGQTAIAPPRDQAQSAPTPPPSALPDWSSAPPLPTTVYRNWTFQEGPTYVLEYRDAQTRLHYRYTPASGSLHDLEVAVADELSFLPSHYGGPRFVVDGRDIPIWDIEPA